MADCELLENCPFFNDKMAKIPTMATMMKKKYCKSDYSNCARYIVFKKLGSSKVPSDLYPNQLSRTKEIIK